MSKIFAFQFPCANFHFVLAIDRHGFGKIKQRAEGFLDFISGDGFLGIQLFGDESAGVDATKAFSGREQLVFCLAFARGAVWRFLAAFTFMVAPDFARNDAAGI